MVNAERMAKVYCSCGSVIFDQTDKIRNKAHFIGDQDYHDMFEEIQGKEFIPLATAAVKYFGELFQCDHCNNLIVFRPGSQEGIFFAPADKYKSKNILQSYRGEKWQGVLSGKFRDGKSEIYWFTNGDEEFRQDLSLDELRIIYNNKFNELSARKVLRYASLEVNGKKEHIFTTNEKQ